MRTAVSRQFSAPADVVWNAMCDIPHAAERISSITRIEMLTPGAVGEGTRWRETRIMMKREHTEEMEIAQWSPPRSYVAACESCGCAYRFEVSVQPESDGGSRVEMTFEAKPLSFPAKVMAAATGWMMKRMCRKACERDLADIDRWLDAQHRAAPAAQPA